MSVPDHIIAASAALVPSEDKLVILRSRCQAWWDKQQRIEELEAEAKKLKAEALEMQHRELPSLFSDIGIDNIGLPDANVDIVVRPYYKASISADWPPEQQEEAFRVLEQHGGGPLVQVVVSVAFAKGEIEKARELQELIRQSPIGNTHPVNVKMGVNWNTLTSWIREIFTRDPETAARLMGAGQEVVKTPLEKLGATVGQIADIKKRNKK